MRRVGARRDRLVLEDDRRSHLTIRMPRKPNTSAVDDKCRVPVLVRGLPHRVLNFVSSTQARCCCQRGATDPVCRKCVGVRRAPFERTVTFRRRTVRSFREVAATRAGLVTGRLRFAGSRPACCPKFCEGRCQRRRRVSCRARLAPQWMPLSIRCVAAARATCAPAERVPGAGTNESRMPQAQYVRTYCQ